MLGPIEKIRDAFLDTFPPPRETLYVVLFSFTNNSQKTWIETLQFDFMVKHSVLVFCYSAIPVLSFLRIKPHQFEVMQNVCFFPLLFCFS